jgi:hypothetical protein
MTLPYGMQPAPARQPKVSPPIDLGAYDASYTGWQVVVDLDVPLSALNALNGIDSQFLQDAERLDDLPDAQKLAVAQTGMTQVQSMQHYVAICVVAWNFVRTLPDGTVETLPQPAEGGVEFISAYLNGLLVRVIGDAQRPKKARPPRSTRRS